MPPRVFCVVSTFHPDQGVVENILKNSMQCDQLIVVDDGSPDSHALQGIDGKHGTVIRLPENVGIAAALNAGMKMALDRGAEYILTLDQDTVLDSGYVAKALNPFESAAKATKVGIVHTDGVNHEYAVPPYFSPEGFGLIEEGIQSGMLISAECLKDVGLLDERLFIDCVDTEFCVRSRDAGWKIAVAPGSNISHSLGRLEPEHFLFHKGDRPGDNMYHYHPPFRRYYITRNNVDLILRNWRKHPRWSAIVAKRDIKTQIKTLISGPQRMRLALAMNIGAIHGIVRRRGKIPQWLNNAVR